MTVSHLTVKMWDLSLPEMTCPRYVCLFTAADTFCPAVIFPRVEPLACRTLRFDPRVGATGKCTVVAWPLCKGVLNSLLPPLATSAIFSILRLRNARVTFHPGSKFAPHLLQSHSEGVKWVSGKRPNVALPLFTLFSDANCVGERTVIMWGFCSSVNPAQSCVAERFSLSRKTL